QARQLEHLLDNLADFVGQSDLLPLADLVLGHLRLNHCPRQNEPVELNRVRLPVVHFEHLATGQAPQLHHTDTGNLVVSGRQCPLQQSLVVRGRTFPYDAAVPTETSPSICTSADQVIMSATGTVAS